MEFQIVILQIIQQKDANNVLKIANNARIPTAIALNVFQGIQYKTENVWNVAILKCTGNSTILFQINV